MFKLLKRLYELNVMPADRLKWYVDRKTINADQYKEITGEAYEPENNETTESAEK